MRIGLPLAAILLVYARTLLAVPAFTNEPSGSTILLDWGFNTAAGNGLIDAYKSGRVVSDPTAPYSPSSVLEQVRPCCNGTGGTQLDYYPKPQVYQIFIGFWWKPSIDFEGNSNSSNKIILPVNNQSASVISWFGAQNGPLRILYNLQNSGVLNNCHLQGNWGDPNVCQMFEANVNSAVADRGVWHKVEFYSKLSTTSSSKDGVVRIWLDDKLTHSFTNVNNGPSPFHQISLNHTWDGGFAGQTKQWTHEFDHLRISEPHGAPDPLIITTASLPGPRVGQPYTATLQAGGGKPPYSWFLDSAALPTGLTLNQSTGAINGAALYPGRTTFKIRVIDANQPSLSFVRTYTLVASGTSQAAARNEPVHKQPSLTAEIMGASLKVSWYPKHSGPYTIGIYELSGRVVFKTSGVSKSSLQTVTWEKRIYPRGVLLVRLEQQGASLSSKVCKIQ